MGGPLTSDHGRVFDGRSFQDVVLPATPADQRRPRPVPPAPPAVPLRSTIFVSIPQFRDGRRCARTVQRLFASASRPDRVTVGLIEQTDPERPSEDPTCLDEYCALMGVKTGEHGAEIAHKGEEQADRDRVLEKCPRAKKQIRSVKFHHLAAKGPVYARSFVRKILGNEEFCMQIDAATDFAQGWDDLAITEWMKTGNEYAILSTAPKSGREREKGGGGGAEVPRLCSIKIGSEGVPLFENVADGKAIGLTRPLLSASYSSSFAFGKCHFETNVPHDPFAVQLLNTEKFPRYARLWTRGYDVYTPSTNVVYKDNTMLHPLHHTAGHGDKGEKKWPKNDNDRRDAHVRMKVLLDIHHGITGAEAAALGAGSGIGGKISTARANLGVYGLGRRRTLGQLLDFTGIALPGGGPERGGHGNDGRGCASPVWVPYDAFVPPRANLFDGTGRADDLDPDPEFPLRTLPDETDEQYPIGDAAWDELAYLQKMDEDGAEASSEVPYSVVFLLWVTGIYVWYCTYVGSDNSAMRRRDGSVHVPGSSVRKPRRKIPLSAKPLKNI